jgi:hypothetical protein
VITSFNILKFIKRLGRHQASKLTILELDIKEKDLIGKKQDLF